MKSFVHRLFFCLAIPGLFLVTGCQDTGGTQSSPNSGSSGSNNGGENAEEEVVRDTRFEVIERRRSGGELQPTGEVSAFDGRARMERAEVKTMIIVKGNETGQESAYLLPESDYNRVQVGHRLQESTLQRWEPTSSDTVPPPPPPPESPLRSSTGGAAENLVY